MKHTALLILAVGVLAIAAGASASVSGGGHSAAKDIGWLNAQRAANGFPSSITENADWSAKCDAHVTYMQKTHQFGHTEDASSQDYTAGGDWAAKSSVISLGNHWGPNQNPWETSPIHLILMLDPLLAKIGIADRGGYVCATAWVGFTGTPPSTTTVLTYPGEGGKIYTHELDRELPVSPQSVVGLSGQTGPNLLVYVWGPVLRNTRAAGAISITAATLSGPHGAVPVKWVDHTTGSIGPYLPAASGVLIPTRPLQGHSTYSASVTFSNHQHHAWTFKTK